MQQFYRRYGKRLFDCIAATILLIVFAPVILLIAGLILLFLGWPILFVQERPGKDERRFKLLKFRTLLPEMGGDGRVLSHDERLTRFGRILRASSLDELPQLINVLRKEMSLIGPRPLLVEYLPYYSPEERLRHSVLPGITGLAQVNGRNSLVPRERFAMDVEYSRKLSFVFDVRIVFLTVRAIATRQGLEVSPKEVSAGLIKGSADIDSVRSEVNL